MGNWLHMFSLWSVNWGIGGAQLVGATNQLFDKQTKWKPDPCTVGVPDRYIRNGWGDAVAIVFCCCAVYVYDLPLSTQQWSFCNNMLKILALIISGDIVCRCTYVGASCLLAGEAVDCVCKHRLNDWWFFGGGRGNKYCIPLPMSPLSNHWPCFGPQWWSRH